MEGGGVVKSHFGGEYAVAPHAGYAQDLSDDRVEVAGGPKDVTVPGIADPVEGFGGNHAVDLRCQNVLLLRGRAAERDVNEARGSP